MKSRRRHELQTNELADALGRFVQRVRPHAWTVAVIAGAGVILVVVLISVPIMRSRAADDAACAFHAAVRAGRAEALRTFLDGYPESEQASTARLLLADRLLRQVAAGEVDPDDAEAMLEEAEAFYAQVAKASEDLAPMARTGLALVTLHRGDLEAGRKALEQVAEQWPQSVAAPRAKAHLEALAEYEPVDFSDEPLQEPVGSERAPPASAEEAVPGAPAGGLPAETPSEEPEEKARPVG